MALRRLARADLASKVIDVHSHVGVSIKAYAAAEYPYAQGLEGLYYRQLAGGVDVNVVFPLSGDLYFDYEKLACGELVPATRPASEVPYGAENRLLLREVYEFCPEMADRFLPFVCVDPERAVPGQIAELRSLAADYPLYGLKVNPVGCQSHASGLMGVGEGLLDFAGERDIPLLFHATTVPGDEYSRAEDIFRIVDSRPQLRFCLAHCLIFNRACLERADAAPNVWVDTAAMKIQVLLAQQEIASGALSRDDLVEADFSDHLDVMVALFEAYPGTMVWGTDSPAYSYICRRKQAEGNWYEFNLKAAYEDEVAALACLPEELRKRASNVNTLEFLFGPAA